MKPLDFHPEQKQIKDDCSCDSSDFGDIRKLSCDGCSSSSDISHEKYDKVMIGGAVKTQPPNNLKRMKTNVMRDLTIIDEKGGVKKVVKFKNLL